MSNSPDVGRSKNWKGQKVMEFKLFEAIAAGGDLATIAIGIGFYKLANRITILETSIKYIRESIANVRGTNQP
jgi:hypothetical protein